MKYIDAERLKAEIERRIGICKRVAGDERSEEDMRRYYQGKVVALEEIQHLAPSLQQEQPSLLSDLDEAAEKNFETMEVLEHENIFEETHHKIFKAGAEWMAGQGETVEGVFKAGDPGYPDVRMGEQYSIEHILRKPGGIEPGDEVLVQIRKK